MPLLSRFMGLRRRCAGPDGRPGELRKAPDDRQTLHFPLRFDGNLAVLEAGFRMERGMREFGEADLEKVADFRPAAVVAPLHTALYMADRKLDGLNLASLRVALVVLTRVDGELLTGHHRDLLWRAFGVPVFEQLRDSEGIVIARECEVHDGLHMAAAVSVTQISCEIVNAHCDCGAETPRIRNLAPLRRAAAAAA